jgi:hypothetical protein
VSIVHCDIITAHRELGVKETVARSQLNWLQEMDAVYSYKDFLLRYKDIRCHNPEDHNIYRHCHENLTSVLLLYRPNAVVQRHLHSKACVQPRCKVI